MTVISLTFALALSLLIQAPVASTERPRLGFISDSWQTNPYPYLFQTEKEEIVAEPEPEGTKMTVIFSRYWPPLGGINCQYPCNLTANGLEWAEWVPPHVPKDTWAGRIDGIAACPRDLLARQAIIVWPGGDRIWCQDTGGKIVFVGENKFWMDLLSPVDPPGMWFGKEFEVTVIFP